jgi:hypothetical protein
VEALARGRLQALCGLLAPLVFTAAWVAAGLVQSHYDARREDISALAAETADDPWIMISGLVVAGALTVAFSPTLHRVLARGSLVGPALVALDGLGVIGLGVLRNDCSSRTAACETRVEAGAVSWHHTAHDVLSAPVFALAVAAPLVLALRFRRDPAFAPLVPVSIVTSFALAALFAAAGLETIPGWEGVLQRLAATIAFLWLGAVAFRLLLHRGL